MKKASIFILDDDIRFGKTLGDILRFKGYSAQVYSDSKAALNDLPLLNPVVVLIDLRLGTLSGLDVLQEIKALSPTTKCIVLTGHASQTSAIKAINAGAYGYMLKPYDVEQLLMMVHQAVGQREAQQALQDSEERYRTLVESMNDGLAAADENMINTFVNTRFCEMVGYTQDELLGKSLFTVIDDEGQTIFRQPWEMREEGGNQSYELPLIRKDGTRIIVLISPSPIYDEQGHFKGSFAVMTDITERYKAETALRESEARFRTLVEHSSEALVVLDVDQERFVDVNEQAVRLFGLDREQLLQVHPADLSPPLQPNGQPSAPSAREQIEKALRGEAPVYEWVHRHAQGDDIPCEIRLVRLPSSAGRLVRGNIMDITARKRAQEERERFITELEARNAELELFTHTLSHDLKNPLVTIKGFLGLLEEDMVAGEPERIEKDLGVLHDAANKLQALLKDLIDLPRIGLRDNPLEALDLTEVIHASIDHMKEVITTHGIAVEVAPDLPAVFADRTRLTEVFQHLIGNAVKFMGVQPEPKIEIGAHKQEKGIRCYVRDNGMGIDPKYHEKVFRLFERLDQQVGGTGIGLTRVKRIVEAHGGRVWIESEGAGTGSAVCFYLPQNGNAHSSGRNDMRYQHTGSIK